MLNSFDWVRRSRTGAELLATIRYLAAEEEQRAKGEDAGKDACAPCSMPSIGPPHSALNGPCQRCWIYPRIPRSEQEDYSYCEFCKAILAKTRGLGNVSRNSAVIWGFVNRLPKHLQNGEESHHSRILGVYVHDENRFLLMVNRRRLRNWIQELALYDGTDLKGLIQILPTIGSGRKINMGDVLCRAIHHEANFPMDRLRIRFYSAPYQLLRPHIRDRQGILTFEVPEFLRLMEMAIIFRALLRPEERKMLHELLNIDDTAEERFYWGRFQGNLNQKAKDMLNSWKIRNWSKSRVKLLYEIVDYVYVDLSRIH